MEKQEKQNKKIKDIIKKNEIEELGKEKPSHQELLKQESRQMKEKERWRNRNDGIRW